MSQEKLAILSIEKHITYNIGKKKKNKLDFMSLIIENL